MGYMFLAQLGWVGQVSMFGVYRYWHTAVAVILDEFHSQGFLFSASYCLAFSQLFGRVVSYIVRKLRKTHNSAIGS